MQVLIGLLLALLAVVGGHYLDGGQLQQLLNPAAALIVFGGTGAAVVIQNPGADFRRVWLLTQWAFTSRDPDFKQGIELLADWCNKARRGGLLTLEREARQQSDPFISRGLQMLADGRVPEVIRSVMEVDMIARENRDLQAARIVESMGGYAPTMGIIGAVIGLIQVMANLSDPDALGAGIATAFVATIYGVGAANLLFIPLANKIKRMVFGRSEYQQMMMEGVLYIGEGLGPKAIEQRLEGYQEAADA